MRIRTVWLVLAAGLPAQESAPASRPQLPGAQWTDPVREAVAGADVVRVWPISRRPERQRLLLEVKDPDSIAQLIAEIAFKDHPSGGFCLCTGQHEIEFSRGQGRLALLVFHHAFMVDWLWPWPGDGHLTQASRDFVAEWCARRGMTEFRDELARQEAERLAKARTWERRTAGMSATLAAALQGGEEPFQRVLAAEFPNPLDRLPTLLQVYGADEEPTWSPAGSRDRGEPATRLLREYEPRVLRVAAVAAVLGDDPIARLGGARILVERESEFMSGAPADLARIRWAVVEAELAGHDRAERCRGLEHLMAWSEAFPAEEVHSRVRAASKDPDSGVRGDALLAMGKLGLRDEIPQLLETVRGSRIEDHQPASRAAADPYTVGAEARAAWRRERHVERTALVLGYLRVEEARPLLAARRDDIALALMDEPQRLRPTHFHAGLSRFEDPERRIAAVEAVVRCRGRFGLEMALAYRCDSSDERSAVARSLRRMLLAQDPPGRPHLEEAKSLADLRRWFAQHGQDYLGTLK